MATATSLEILRQSALEEQLAAACDRRPINTELLSDLAQLVLPANAPVYCHSTDSLYKSEKGKIEPAAFDPMLGGRFGGFVVRESMAITGKPIEKVHFFVANSSLDHEGYLCPVETSKLVDINEELRSDQLFGELSSLLGGALTLDAFIVLNKLYKESDPETHHLYVGYMNAVAAPDTRFDALYAQDYSVINVRNETGASFVGPTTRFQLDKGATFGIIQTSPTDREGTLSIMWGDVLVKAIEVQRIVAAEVLA